VKRNDPRIALACLFCAGFQSLAQAPSGARATPIATADPFVMTWKPNCPGCDDRYENGLEEKGLFTNQSSLIVFLIPDSGKLAVSVYVGNPAEGAGRIEVNPASIRLFKTTDKGLSELKRAEAAKMAKSMERKVRIGSSIAAGLSSYGSQTTATATSSDGTTTTVTMPDPQAQTDAINRAHGNIAQAQAKGAYLIGEELKRTTLDPGQNTMGRVFFPEQKGGENLLLRADIGNVRYEIPLHLPGKHETSVAPSATRKGGSQPPQQTAASVLDTAPPNDTTNLVQMATWYRKAAEQGDAKAQFNLGWAYEQGQGVEQDYAQAAAWWRKSADQGNDAAQNNLGSLYENGQGVPQDYVQAAAWYRKAANQGLAEAQYSLGYAYHDGQGVPQDYVLAVQWCRKAADQGNADAQFSLGRLYEFGEGVSQDYGQAVAWFRKAAERGEAGAQNSLGWAYEHGQGVPQDYAQAIAWYRKAAEQGNDVGQFNLGALYAEGQSLAQDYAEAYFWMDIAASHMQGTRQESAAKFRDEAAAKLSPDDLSKAQQRAAEWFAAHPPQ
jgi:TPR repeat protein